MDITIVLVIVSDLTLQVARPPGAEVSTSASPTRSEPTSGMFALILLSLQFFFNWGPNKQ